ncbi:GTPase Era, mitochondrial [Lycorma delicatula]|uniref:GTPase Era, mitochondrial n=1 Tax=Lycorma delicatula TaxID=130591 RepID=UPI003F50EB50
MRLRSYFAFSNFYQQSVVYFFGNSFNKSFISIVRNYSVYDKRRYIHKDGSNDHVCEHNEIFEDYLLDEESSKPVESPKNSKILKAAIIGNPNVGKSTLINQIVGRQIFAISRKVHTTRCRARAIYIRGSTQLVFLDTPGLVTGSESRKYNLERSFLNDCESSIQEADVVCIVHDVASDHYNDTLDPKILRLLHFYPSKHTILIMNKIDCIKSKRVLLDLADGLTCNTMKQSKHHKSIKNNVQDWSPKTELSVEKAIKKQKGWPYFKEVFMVSALDRNGVGDIKEYLLSCAKPGDWLFPPNVFTDQTYIKMIEETVQAKLFDSLPNEIPYNLSTQLEYYDQGREGTITTVVLVGCKTPRIEKLVMGAGGKRIKTIARAAEEDLSNIFRVPVRLRVVVTKKRDRKVNIDDLVKSGSLDVLQTN